MPGISQCLPAECICFISDPRLVVRGWRTAWSSDTENGLFELHFPGRHQSGCEGACDLFLSPCNSASFRRFSIREMFCASASLLVAQGEKEYGVRENKNMASLFQQ